MDKNLISIENTEFINQIEAIGNKLTDTGKTMMEFTKKLECKVKTKSNEIRDQVEVIHVPNKGDKNHIPKRLKMEVWNTDLEEELDRLDNKNFLNKKLHITKKEGDINVINVMKLLEVKVT